MLGVLLLTLRELRAKWIVVGLFVIATLLWGAMALALQLDIVDGSLAGARLFGQEASFGEVAADEPAPEASGDAAPSGATPRPPCRTRRGASGGDGQRRHGQCGRRTAWRQTAVRPRQRLRRWAARRRKARAVRMASPRCRLGPAASSKASSSAPRPSSRAPPTGSASSSPSSPQAGSSPRSRRAARSTCCSPSRSRAARCCSGGWAACGSSPSGSSPTSSPPYGS